MSRYTASFSEEQRSCSSLKPFWQLAKQDKKGFFVNTGLFYHFFIVNLIKMRLCGVRGSNNCVCLINEFQSFLRWGMMFPTRDIWLRSHHGNGFV